MGQHRKGNRRLWVTADYRHVELRDMSPDHLGNALDMLLLRIQQRRPHGTHHPHRPRGVYTLWRARGTSLSWVRAFARELVRRGYTYTPRKLTPLAPFVPQRWLRRPPFAVVLTVTSGGSLWEPRQAEPRAHVDADGHVTVTIVEPVRGTGTVTVSAGFEKQYEEASARTAALTDEQRAEVFHARAGERGKP